MERRVELPVTGERRVVLPVSAWRWARDMLRIKIKVEKEHTLLLNEQIGLSWCKVEEVQLTSNLLKKT